MARKRKYAVIYTNCDCSSGTIARPTPLHYRHGPRCGCGKILGLMQWFVVCYIVATDQRAALEEYRKQQRKRSWCTRHD